MLPFYASLCFLVNEPPIKSFRQWKSGTFHLRKVVSDLAGTTALIRKRSLLDSAYRRAVFIPNLGDPNGSINRSQFGRITGAATGMREFPEFMTLVAYDHID